MVWSGAEAVCRSHPSDAPQPGVCPSCLRERLSTICGKYSTTYNMISLSSPSLSASPVYYRCHSSASSSGRSSPQRRHQRVASDIMESIYVAMRGHSGLIKSRSMVCEPRNSGGRNQKKKKGGFWNKLLLRSTRRKPNKLW